MPEKPRLRALTGCTAVGKTEWALRWAEDHGAEIVSCDSLLFYRGMDLGTAKPTATELARVPHHLVDTCAVSDQMNVTRYIALARAVLEGIAARGRTALVVGGSGFYLKAFFSAVADEIEVPEPIRAEARSLSLEAAVSRLKALNPGGLGGLDTANPRRVSRALERCLASGRTLADLAAEFERQPSAFADWEVELTEISREPPELEQRIARRAEAMVNAGLIEEVRRLLEAGLLGNHSAAGAIGYREVIALLEGRLSREQLVSEIAKNTRALVKKQRTWFRNQLPEHRVLAATAIRSASQLFGA